MKLVSFRAPGAAAGDPPRVGALTPDGQWVVDLRGAAQASGGDGAPFDSMLTLLAAGEGGLTGARTLVEQAAHAGARRVPVAGIMAVGEVLLGPPVGRPGKVLALAANYPSHRAEGGGSSPSPSNSVPEVFSKPGTSVVGPEDAIRLPGLPVTAVDYEGELGVVIGRTCRQATEGAALEYVAGYLNVNDISARALDPGFERSPEFLSRARFFDWLVGKWCDTFCPMGPWLVTADEVPNPMALTVVTRVNGEERQRASSGEMIHSVARAISWCSQLMTLEPGDVIATGTPAGVGSATGRYLRPGDVVEVEVTGLGVLRNRVE